MDQTERQLRDRFLVRLNAALGVKEVPPGSNRGPQVDIYIVHGFPHDVDAAGHPTQGREWCALLAKYELDTAARDIGLASPFDINPWVPSIVLHAQQQGRILQPASVQGGDLVLFSQLVGGKLHYHHVETCTGPVAGGFVNTIGGNTSRASGLNPNGGECCAKHRSIAGAKFVNVCRLI